MTDNHYASIMMGLDSLKEEQEKLKNQMEQLNTAMLGDLKKDKPGIIELVRQNCARISENCMKIKGIYGLLTFVALTCLSILGSMLYIILSSTWDGVLEKLLALLI